MRVITIYNKKGGTGKTSVATNLATNLAAAGYRVGLLDGDEQANASTLTSPHQYGKPTLTHLPCAKQFPYAMLCIRRDTIFGLFRQI